jgi:radical SAM superfamily enzyme with C-terminal helix-hairpin-helix motif
VAVALSATTAVAVMVAVASIATTHAVDVMVVATSMTATTVVAVKVDVVTNAQNHVQQLALVVKANLPIIVLPVVHIFKVTSLQVQHPAVALAM